MANPMEATNRKGKGADLRPCVQRMDAEEHSGIKHQQVSRWRHYLSDRVKHQQVWRVADRVRFGHVPTVDLESGN
jgi:hypothetical protein